MAPSDLNFGRRICLGFPSNSRLFIVPTEETDDVVAEYPENDEEVLSSD